jgi:OOP family OmpA-OmpF porin
MKRLLQFKLIHPFILICFSALISHAQTAERKWNINFMFGFTEYAGDLGNGFLSFDQTTIDNTYTYGLGLTRYLNPSFDFGMMGTYGSWGYFEGATAADNFKATEMLNLNLHAKYKFNNGYMLEESSLFAPYILAGTGIVRLKGSGTNPGDDVPLILGVGLKMQLGEVVGLNYQATYGYLITSDKRDFSEIGSLNDAFLTHTVGLSFNLGKGKDEDGDGVIDKKDKCPGTPRNAKVDADGCPVDTDKDGVADYLDACPDMAGTVKGCPDSDKDGIADREDQCPGEAGLATLKGCPDADGDGITDSKDKCPNVAGVLAFDGCPDKDGDGIRDEDDKCPDVAGVKMFNGCPDTDNDSIPDVSDLCPTKRGPASTKGCPDTDLDGVHDGIDKCPTIAGTAANSGCPEIKKETKQLFQKALQGIQFETGKATIKPVSYPILDAVVKVLIENPSYKLMIGGHTDDVGNDETNMTLSQNRADAVAKYLISKGVNPVRVSATGYGETRPVDTNKTKAGKARNRRVELSVEFIETTVETK